MAEMKIHRRRDPRILLNSGAFPRGDLAACFELCVEPDVAFGLLVVGDARIDDCFPRVHPLLPLAG
jgi:hypothetical protein